MNLDINQKKQLVENYFKKKKNTPLIDVYFDDLEKLSLYIRLELNKKTNTYRLYWVNLTAMESKKVEDWLNSNLVYPSTIDKIVDTISMIKEIKDNNEESDIKANVTVNFYFDYFNNSFSFNRYIPKCYDFLADIFYYMFDAIPKYLYLIFQIMIEKLVVPQLNTVFVYDINDNIDELFDEKVIKDGKKCYKENKVTLIEKKEESDITYAVVKGRSNYLVSIINNPLTKEVSFTCNCDSNSFCKHIYATLLAMKNNETRKFFKVASVGEKGSIMDIIKNFNYEFCADIYGDNFVIVKSDSFVLYPIIINGKITFKIIEDDKDKTLEKKLNEYLKKINYKK